MFYSRPGSIFLHQSLRNGVVRHCLQPESSVSLRQYVSTWRLHCVKQIPHKSCAKPVVKPRRVRRGSNISRFNRFSSEAIKRSMSTSATKMSSKQDYTFPQSKLKLALKDPSKQPLVLVACGSFSPITYLHLRMFEMASDYVRLNTNFELVGCYLSPVSDAYKKKGLASAEHRYVIP